MKDIGIMIKRGYNPKTKEDEVKVQIDFLRYGTILFYRGENERYRNSYVFYNLETYSASIRDDKIRKVFVNYLI